ncbi:DUF397 domain-containing protein [Streptantibioticus ferralitis]|uniref:DUF397 domain-containing protein n=1 Tax=Streptantibioticus ferralitis TaxID=236510 RepID=A0ABT5Z793_9ACTN|nr:DUF397 domain-containing protein [Streptantibioticus ferralitis]MDF2259684.1 DUF397 domain-containing protein [Streptantibioticus ferralitis]
MTRPSADQLASANWFKSTHSAANNECVEVAMAGAWVCVRDSTDPHGPMLSFTASAFASFVEDVQRNNIASGIGA